MEGPVNSYEPGTPLNVAYGTIELPPAILNWYRRGNSGRTRAYFIGSLGHGQIAGCRGKLNGLGFSHYYGKNLIKALKFILLMVNTNRRYINSVKKL